MTTAIKLLVRVLCDVRPKCSVDGAYLYCQTDSNHQSLFQTAFFLLEKSFTSKILILQTEAKSGYPGFSQWLNLLQKAGLSEKQIVGVELDTPVMLHTMIESEALVRFASQKGYKSLFVIAPPFHQLRAFMTAVTVVLKTNSDLLLYSFPADAMPWGEAVVHSQGTLMATRKELIHMELERISLYQKKGELASFEEVAAYLDSRQVLS